MRMGEIFYRAGDMERAQDAFQKIERTTFYILPFKAQCIEAVKCFDVVGVFNDYLLFSALLNVPLYV